MTLVNLLKDGYSKKNWDLIAQAYELMTGQKIETEKRAEPSVPVHRLNINDSQPVKKVSAMENKFVDDLTLETDLIDNNPKARKKVYREPFSENNMYTTLNCVQCGKSIKVTKEEVRFRRTSSESNDFTCIKCMRGNK